MEIGFTLLIISGFFCVSDIILLILGGRLKSWDRLGQGLAVGGTAKANALTNSITSLRAQVSDLQDRVTGLEYYG